MATDYSFFERALDEWRTYKPRVRQWRELVQLPYFRSRVQAIGYPGGDHRFRVRHLMDEPNPIGVAQLNEQFNITLAAEVDDFYRQWDGGTLFFRQIYQVLSVRQIIEITQNIRIGQHGLQPADTPYDVLRFCHMNDEYYLALRRKPEGGWEVMFAPPGPSDADLLTNDEETRGYVTDPGFPSWLRRMCETDGWPIGGYEFEPEPPPADRLD